MGRIGTSSRYVIDIIGWIHSLWRNWGGGDFQCFGEFGAFVHARTMKNWKACQGPEQIDLIAVVSPIRPSGGLEGEEKL